ncbi:hypothetical protein JDV09_08860 [Mycobacterium sp. Y57]|uniref:hypothetical protein n=1 Tax=Mycolicibacterium xanthum TaxID=2796469 RepID=UPI001C84C74C|nr:hypothetical protein [Mycolicibacterium xanthum]MBX7432217.1 hypothetical protein [Mycolicibacterium xanthum]
MASGDLESRVAALEGQVRDLNGRVRASQHDAAAARVLAGAADRDVGEIRGELRDFRQGATASFNALRRDFVDLRAHVDDGFTRIDDSFTEMHGRLDAAAAGQQQIVALLSPVLDERGQA